MNVLTDILVDEVRKDMKVNSSNEETDIGSVMAMKSANFVSESVDNIFDTYCGFSKQSDGDDSISNDDMTMVDNGDVFGNRQQENKHDPTCKSVEIQVLDLEESAILNKSDIRNGQVDSNMISTAAYDGSGFISIERKTNPISRKLTLNNMTFGNFNDAQKGSRLSIVKWDTSLNSLNEQANGFEGTSPIEDINDAEKELKVSSHVEMCQNEGATMA